MPSEKKVRPVPLYLKYKERAGCAPNTIIRYRDALRFYAGFLQVPIEDLHNRMTVENFMEYLDSDRMKGLAPNSRRSAISAISTYMRISGIEFDELELAVVKVRVPYDRNDKPPDLEIFRKMMDVADVRMKAVISFLISTGCRRGETSKVLLSDVRENAVNIRNEIAKGGRGGKVYLNSEAREYLDLWLRERDAWICRADQLAKQIHQPRPVQDNRLFASSDGEIGQRFSGLYKIVDGESITTGRGQRNLITPHSCRAYFRTHAVATMGIDLVEGIMRHTGYLNAAYFRMTDEERERQYHEGERALYITRKDQRVQDDRLARVERERDESNSRLDDLQETVRKMEEKLALVKITDGEEKT